MLNKSAIVTRSQADPVQVPSNVSVIRTQVGPEMMLQKLERIIQRFEQECKAQNGKLVMKTNHDLQRLLIGQLNEILSHGFEVQNYRKKEAINVRFHVIRQVTVDTTYYSIFQAELPLMLSLKYISLITTANTDKKKAFLWLLLELSCKSINITLREQSFECYLETSLIKAQRTQLKRLISQLENVNYVIEGDLVARYKAFYEEQVQKDLEQSRLKEEQIKQQKQIKLQQQQQLKLPIPVKVTPQVEQASIPQPNKSTEANQPQIHNENAIVKDLSPQPVHHEKPASSDPMETPTQEERKEEEPQSFPNFLTPQGKKPNQLFNMFNKTTPEPTQQQEPSLLPIHLTKKWRKDGKKASQILFDEIYKEICEMVNTNFCAKPDQTMTLKEQDFKCWTCQRKISTGFYTLGSNCDYCYYSGRWHCSDCLSDQRMPIPWKAIEFFDLKHYKVSTIAFQEIEKLYTLPIISIEYNAMIVQKSKTLFEFMVLKRQLHLLYDMICDSTLVEQLLEKRMNLCLKQNYFSLKDLYEIYNGSLIKILEGYYAIFHKHVLNCKSCSKRGQTCQICKSVSVVHAFDIRFVTYCDKCRNLYHRQCLEQNNCPYCLVNNS